MQKEGDHMTKYETMSASVLKHVSKREYIHKQWVERQNKFKNMVAQDCYGVQKRKENEI